MDETTAGGMYYEKNYLKKKQKSKSPPGSCRGNDLQTAGKRRNRPITRMMIARMVVSSG